MDAVEFGLAASVFLACSVEAVEALTIVLAVSQSLFTISLFLFYWRKQGIPAPAVPAAT